MAGGTTIVDRLNKLSGKEAMTIAKALENLEEGGGIGGFEIHICASGEYDAETKVPTIEEPDSSTLYLVPTTEEAGDLFDEYIWTGEVWERFGAGSVNIQNPDWNENDPTSAAYIENRPFYTETVYTTVYEGDVPFTNNAGTNYYYSFNGLELSNKPSLDSTLLLNIDGIEYESQVQQGSSGVFYIGAKDPGDSAITENKVGISLHQTGEKELGRLYMAEIAASERSSGTYHVTLSVLTSVVHKLKKDYLELDELNIENGNSVGSLIQINPHSKKDQIGDYAVSFGDGTTASGANSHAEGLNTAASGTNSHAEGLNTTASGGSSHAEGCNAKANGEYSHAEGSSTIASGANSHAEGYNTTASKEYSHAEGYRTTASGGSSHAEGYITKATGSYSHAEGSNTTASGGSSHAEGSSTTANGSSSHAEGRSSGAYGDYSHAEGEAKAHSRYSHAEGSGFAGNGNMNQTVGEYSHAEGKGSLTYGNQSHAEGWGTIAHGRSQHTFGEWNIEDTATAVDDSGTRGDYIEIVGNGYWDGATQLPVRSNARTLDWSGNESLAGSLTLGKGTTDEVTVTAAQLKALIALLNA